MWEGDWLSEFQKIRSERKHGQREEEVKV